MLSISGLKGMFGMDFREVCKSIPEWACNPGQSQPGSGLLELPRVLSDLFMVHIFSPIQKMLALQRENWDFRLDSTAYALEIPFPDKAG